MTVPVNPARLTRVGRWILLLPFLGIMVVFALDQFGHGRRFTFEPALTVGPALAAVVSDWVWFPLLVGAVALGEAFAFAVYDDTLNRPVHSASILAIILISLVSSASVALRNRQEQELADARVVAEVAQRILLRPVPDRVGPVRAAVHYAAAAAHARIGGDLYEVVRTRHGVRAVIGDVRGKGLGAVETAAAVLGAFREAAHQEPSLSGVAAWLADSLARSLSETNGGPASYGAEEEFVTLLLVCVRDDGYAEVVNCGHPSPVLLHADAAPRLLDAPRPVPPLGVLEPGEVAAPALPVQLAPGDRLLLYTDGVIEARDRSGVFYPLTDRLPECARAGSPAEVLERVDADVRRHVGHSLSDDAAMLLIEYAPPTPPDRPLNSPAAAG